MTRKDNRIRVLVVDDSAVMRLVLTQMIEEAGFQVVATAADGLEAIEKARKYDPDVITLDVQMPGMNGIEAIEELNRQSRAAILMVSSLTKAGAELTILALEKGAFDYIPKRNGLDKSFSTELARKIRLASAFVRKARTSEDRPGPCSAGPSRVRIHLPRAAFRRDPVEEAVVIGASTGGPRVLTHILSNLSGDFPLGILVVQHMPAEFTPALAERLDENSPLRVKEAAHGDPVTPGTVFVAPGGKQMTVSRKSSTSIPRIHIIENSGDHIFAPCVDVTMLSVARTYSGPGVGVVLTGMGHDGQKGMRALKERGWITLVQDRESCVVSGMVQSCLDAGAADAEVPLFMLPQVIQQVIGGNAWA